MDRERMIQKFVDRRKRELMDTDETRRILELMDRKGIADADFYKAACEMQYLESEAELDAEIEAEELFGKKDLAHEAVAL